MLTYLELNLCVLRDTRLAHALDFYTFLPLVVMFSERVVRSSCHNLVAVWSYCYRSFENLLVVCLWVSAPVTGFG